VSRRYAYSGHGSRLSATLKRTAHAVRTAVDARRVVDGVNPRRARLVQIPVGETGYVVRAPSLMSARERHLLALSRWENYSELSRRSR
jgi:hypothetical protein